MVAALAGGVAVGAVAGSPGVSGAQEEAASTTADGGAIGAAPDHGKRGGLGLRGMKVEAAAEAIGISEDDLRTQLRDGQTLAEIAEANGVDRQAVVDALVAAGEEQLAELEATLPERMDDVMDHELRSRDGHRLRDRIEERSGN